MAQVSDRRQSGKTVELVTFQVGNAICGMDILKVQEINKYVKMTQVPQAPEYVLGGLEPAG